MCAKWDGPSGEDHVDPAKVANAPDFNTPRTITLALTLSKCPTKGCRAEDVASSSDPKKATKAAPRHCGRQLIAL